MRMGTDFDFGPAQAEFKEGNSLTDGGIASRILPGLLQFLAQPGQRLGIENRSSLALFGSGLVHQRLQPVKIAANRLGGWPETGLTIIVNEGVHVLLRVPMKPGHDVVVEALGGPMVAT